MRQRGPGPAPAPAPADPVRAASVRAIAEQLSTLRGPLLPVLHEVVATHGYVTDDDVLVVAEVLNLSRADVHGVVTFYSDLRRTPPAAHRVALCRGEACQARGAEGLHAAATDRWAGVGRRRGGRGVLPRAVRRRPVGHRRRRAARRPVPRAARRPHVRGGADDDRLGAVRRRRRRARCGCRRRRRRGRRDHGAPQRLARDAVARAARRGRDRARPGRVRQPHRGRGRARCSTARSTAPTAASASSTSTSGSPASTGCRSPGSGSSSPPTSPPTASTAGCAGLQRALDPVARGGRRRGDGVGPARPRRRRLPGRHQVGDGAHGTGRREVRLLQRRRGRQRHLRRPDAHRGRPVHAHRGDDDRGARGRRHRGLRLPAQRVPRTPSRTLRRAIDIAYAHGVLGESVLGSGRRFDLDVRVGAGAYICGEETSMLESLEGKRGEVRAKPPIPALEGLFGRPTVVNNVLTLGRGADGARRRWRGVRRAGHRPLARHPGVPARRQRRPRRHRRGRLRGVARRARRGLRRRHGIRAAGEGGAGGRPAGRLPAAVAVRPADGLRGVRGCRGDGRARRRRRVGRHDGCRGDGAVRDGVLRQGVVRQVHARAASGRRAASRSSTGSARPPTTACGAPSSCCSRTSAPR